MPTRNVSTEEDKDHEDSTDGEAGEGTSSLGSSSNGGDEHEGSGELHDDGGVGLGERVELCSNDDMGTHVGQERREALLGCCGVGKLASCTLVVGGLFWR